MPDLSRVMLDKTASKILNFVKPEGKDNNIKF